jgi:3-methyladenine DNA glycosylase/8-oxoguanine DNA glycosylase
VLERLVAIPAPYDLRGSLGSLAKTGMGSPTARTVDGVVFKATSTPDGPATFRFERVPEGVAVTTWGPGQDWAIQPAPRWLGLHDDPTTFATDHPLLHHQHKLARGKRLGHTLRVFDALLFVVLGQKVTIRGATLARRGLYGRYGEPAPGPVDLRVPPTPAVIRSIGSAAFHPHNVERKRASILMEVAGRANRLEQCTEMPLEDAHRRLRAVRGIGVWTANLVAGVALGDPDAVAYGDFHLKNTVSFLLAGEPRGTDERMADLLAPYAGHQRRVVNYLHATGTKAPRYGPRLGVNDIRGR